MATITRASIPADQFALHDTLRSVPGAEFEIVQVVADRQDRVMPFLWGTADDPDRLPDALEADPSTENVEVLADVGGEYLFRLEWTARTRVILHVLVEEEGTVLEGTGREDRWRFRVLFPEHDAVGSTYEFCEAHGIDLELEQISRVAESFRQGQFGLTESQYETIARAYEGGYYSVPRRKNLEELAEELDVSHQALSERLRRGHETLIENGLRPSSESMP